MMKKVFLIMTLTVSSIWMLTANAQTDAEKVFLEHADKSLEIMEQAAMKMTVKGVAVIAFIPGDISTSWISKMKVAGALKNESANYLAIAYAKIAEMADTFKKSGSAERDPLVGEFGWQGGIIEKVKSGYILAAFSGATGEQDVEIAQNGLDILAKFYE